MQQEKILRRRFFPIPFKQNIPSFFSLAFCLIASRAQAAPMTLEEIYRRATSRSESLSQSRLDIQRQERSLDVAKAAAGSQVRLQANIDGQESHIRDREPAWKNSLKPNLYTEWRYPLYDGKSSYSQQEAARRLIAAETWDVANEREELFLSCARLFYDILGYQQDLKNLRESEEVYRERVATLSQRERIGRARSAEVLAAKTQLQLLLSQIVAAENEMHIAEQRLLWLADVPPPLNLKDEIKPETLNRLETPSRPAAAPLVEAAKARVEAVDFRAKSTAASTRPQLDFIASHRWNYPNDDSVNTFSLGLGLNWLIYDAGQNRNQVAGVELEKQQAQLDQELLTRQASLDQTLANRAWSDGIAQIRDLEQANKAAEQNLKAQQREFENGLLTNLELTQALDTKLQVKRTLDQALYRTKFAYIEAQLRAGRLKITAENVKAPAPDSKAAQDRS